MLVLVKTIAHTAFFVFLFLLGTLYRVSDWARCPMWNIRADQVYVSWVGGKKIKAASLLSEKPRSPLPLVPGRILWWENKDRFIYSIFHSKNKVHCPVPCRVNVPKRNFLFSETLPFLVFFFEELGICCSFEALSHAFIG